MRIKITNLIIVSLISLSVVLSAISNVRAAYQGWGGAMENNTTGGGSTAVYADNSVKDAIAHQGCDDAQANAYRKCYGGNGTVYGDNLMPPNFDLDACIDRADKAYDKCACLQAHDSEACERFTRGIVIPQYTPYKPNVAEITTANQWQRYKQSALNAKVDDQLAPATRAKTSWRPSPIIDSGGTSGGGSVYEEQTQGTGVGMVPKIIRKAIKWSKKKAKNLPTRGAKKTTKKR